MQLFKTEMLFLHSPRTRPAYGMRPLRYGRRLPLRSHVDLPQRSNTLLHEHAGEVDSVDERVEGMDRAA